MDNQKKEKLVAIILTTLVSLAMSVVACILGISPDSLIGNTAQTDVYHTQTAYINYNN